MSWQLALLNRYLRLVERPALARLRDLSRARRRFERQARLVFRNPRRVLYLEDRLQGVPATWASVGRVRRGTVLYFHGGGYAIGSARTHRAMLARLAEMTATRACLPDYRLAPEHPFPAALEDAWRSWNGLLERGYPPGEIVIGGDSAGGGLALTLLARICRRGGPHPAGAFAFSPWTDLTLSGHSLKANARTEALLPCERLPEIRDDYAAGADPADPGLSPLFARFPGCPPVFLQASKAEILLDDTRRMAEALRRQGAEVTLDLWEDTPHVWVIFQGWLPEADAALDKAVAFMRARFRAAPPA